VSAAVGMVGGGQLARMTHQAAIDLGVELWVLCPDADAPAVRAGARHCPGSPERAEDLRRLAARCDVITLDHERTPIEHLEALVRGGHRVAPGPFAARLGQDKAHAREVLEPLGVPCAPWARTEHVDDVVAFGERHGWPLYLKRPAGGYDGRGVWRVEGPAEAAAVVAEVGQVLVEPDVAFTHELSVIVVRSATGEVVTYPTLETVQRDGCCEEVLAPAGVSAEQGEEARALAESIARSVELVGTMAVELFAAPDGLLLNELAVRPHNSGHLTIEACATSQFENHLRAVLGLPLGSTDLVVGAAAMINLTGSPDGSDPLRHLSHALSVPGARVHAYQKQARPGRKLGHVTATGSTRDEAHATVSAASQALVAGVAS